MRFGWPHCENLVPSACTLAAHGIQKHVISTPGAKRGHDGGKGKWTCLNVSPAERRLHRGPAVPTYGQAENHLYHYQQHRIDSAAVRVFVGQVGFDYQRQEVAEEDDEAPLFGRRQREVAKRHQ